MTKWVELFEQIQKDLRDGKYPCGCPLPSENAIVKRFGVSRITVVRAMEELCKRGLVCRKRGSGTFATRMAQQECGRIGLILPSLSHGEIFPPICQTLMRLAQADGYTLVLGDISSERPNRRAEAAREVARRFVAQDIAGVIFQPLAFARKSEQVTREIMALFSSAEIPVVLIDRNADVGESARNYDFVGIDNLEAGRALGKHLLACGAKRISFLMRPNCASVIRDRVDGVMSALRAGAPRGNVIVSEPDDAKTLRACFQKGNRPDAVVCESDDVAAKFNNTLPAFGLRVPDDILLAGFDDVRLAISMTPNLTTVHQPCEDIARTAYRAIRERMRDATLPSRRILLPAPLVIRASTSRQSPREKS